MTGVLLLTIDSLRQDRMAKQYFRNCWHLFENDFTSFTECYSHGVATPFSFPGIHAGSDVEGDGSLNRNTTLAEAATGEAIGLPNNPLLSPWRGYSRGFDRYGFSTSSFEKLLNKLKIIPRQSEIIRRLYNQFSSPFDEVNLGYETADDIVDTTLRDVSTSESFYWAHFMDPHFPFAPNAAPDVEIDLEYSTEEIMALNRKYSDERGGARALSNNELNVLKMLYDENIKFLDRQLAKLLDSLKKSGLYDELLIVVTADHGEAFGENGVFNHQWDADPIDELINVPLLVKPPQSRTSKRVDHMVGHADVYRMIRSYLDDTCLPENHSLFDPEDRIILSKSNTSIRGLTASGDVIKQIDGTITENGTVSERLLQRVKAASFPEIRSLDTGDVVGRPNDNVEDRLKHLGYVDK